MIESRCGIVCSDCTYKEPMNCPGCAHTDKVFWGECEIKKCTESKGLDHCGLCEAFPCETLNRYAHDPEHGDAGLRIEQCRTWAKQAV